MDRKLTIDVYPIPIAPGDEVLTVDVIAIVVGVNAPRSTVAARG